MSDLIDQGSCPLPLSVCIGVGTVPLRGQSPWKITRQFPTLPPSYPGSTIGTRGLNFRVRNGNGCRPSVMIAGI